MLMVMMLAYGGVYKSFSGVGKSEAAHKISRYDKAPKV